MPKRKIMKKEVIKILRGLRAETTDVHAEIEDLRWAESHGENIDWASWHEALEVIEKRQFELARKETEEHLRNVARAHKLVNAGISKDAGIRVLTRACAVLREEYHLGYTGWENTEELRKALYKDSVDAGDESTWPDWVWSLWYDLTPEWSRHNDVNGAHAALREAAKGLCPFDSREIDNEVGGLRSFHKGRRW